MNAKPPPPAPAKPVAAKSPADKFKDATKPLLPWLENAQVLTAAEAAGLRVGLLIGIEKFEEGLDDLISGSNKKQRQATIWQLIPPDDNEYIIDTFLTVAQRVPAAAVAVRGMAELAHRYRLGSILLPRFVHTWMFYAENGGLVLPNPFGG